MGTHGNGQSYSTLLDALSNSVSLLALDDAFQFSDTTVPEPGMWIAGMMGLVVVQRKLRYS